MFESDNSTRIIDGPSMHKDCEIVKEEQEVLDCKKPLEDSLTIEVNFGDIDVENREENLEGDGVLVEH